VRGRVGNPIVLFFLSLVEVDQSGSRIGSSADREMVPRNWIRGMLCYIGGLVVVAGKEIFPLLIVEAESYSDTTISYHNFRLFLSSLQVLMFVVCFNKIAVIRYFNQYTYAVQQRRQLQMRLEVTSS
jgi:hypothetical protein